MVLRCLCTLLLYDNFFYREYLNNLCPNFLWLSSFGVIDVLRYSTTCYFPSYRREGRKNDFFGFKNETTTLGK